MSSNRKRGRVRLHGLLAVTALMAVAAFGYSSHGASAAHRAARDVALTSLTFKESSTVGGDANPAHLEIAFTGTPGASDVVRIRPEKNDATGWRTADPIKPPSDPTRTPEQAKAHVSFNTKDDTGPYIDVTLTGTSPQTVIIDTASPDQARKDTFVTGKIGTADGVDSNKITIAHDAGGG